MSATVITHEGIHVPGQDDYESPGVLRIEHHGYRYSILSGGEVVHADAERLDQDTDLVDVSGYQDVAVATYAPLDGFAGRSDDASWLVPLLSMREHVRSKRRPFYEKPDSGEVTPGEAERMDGMTSLTFGGVSILSEEAHRVPRMPDDATVTATVMLTEHWPDDPSRLRVPQDAQMEVLLDGEVLASARLYNMSMTANGSALHSYDEVRAESMACVITWSLGAAGYDALCSGREGASGMEFRMRIALERWSDSASASDGAMIWSAWEGRDVIVNRRPGRPSVVRRT